MLSLLGTLIFIPFVLFVLMLALGVSVLRMSFGAKSRRKPAPAASRADKMNAERRQRIKSQFKQEGEYVDFEEVPDTITDKA